MLRLGVLSCVIYLALGSPPVTKTREEIEEFRQFLEKSRTDSGVRIDSRMLANPQANIWENSGKFEGDIILRDWQVEALVTDFAAGRAAYIWPNTKWPDNVVVYDFGHNEFNAAQQQIILDAIGWIEHFSCIRFRRRNANDRNYVLLTGSDNGCNAHVGYSADGGVHTMNLARSDPGTGCLQVTVVIHEWLHILGFFHMQSTYNRDNYVYIRYSNIMHGQGHNFERYQSNRVSNLGLPYEYTSCMHYSSHAFSRNGQPTLIPLRSFQGEMGQVDYVTTLDWLRLRRHYNCPGAWNQDEVELLEKEVQRTKPLHENSPPVKVEAEEAPVEVDKLSEAEETPYEVEENQQSNDFSPIAVVKINEIPYGVEEIPYEAEKIPYDVEQNQQSEDFSPFIVVETEDNQHSDDVLPVVVFDAIEAPYKIEEAPFPA